MATIAITGSTDGIGRAAARRLLAGGHTVVLHARNEARGAPVAEELGRLGSVRLVTGDLADLDEVRSLADALGQWDLDVLVHNAGVWPPEGAPPSRQGHELAFAVNALAPHLLTALLHDRVRERLVFLGSGMVGSGRVDPDDLGSPRPPRRAYADSKALDVVLALAWARSLPHLRVGAVDPGWVRTKLASPGAPGDVENGGERVARAAAGEWAGGYTAGSSRARTPRALEDPGLQDRVLAAMDRLAGVGTSRS
ncbi:SDR family NAD(P)-dependent oxidoreductase [Geodermatophilus normandii]|uniref:SDR family NAD(P)-dependent oxidoreductase n=1 Tax=Geodermatophilus normandii TaxID=1137989 RepID=A0A6P0GES4_9ACTN|nr:SDR family NAD(P)-dependent oxidoreductase [Geodermatophilus normandii]NEM05740.1 SDR family NAD(P)-dependent oxidoreductase [Geodermatophilus normandii]